MNPRSDPPPSLLDRPPLGLAALVAAAVVGAMAYVRLGPMRGMILPVAYGVPLLVALWGRSRSLLWAMVVAFSILNFARYEWSVPGTLADSSERWIAWAMVQADILLMAGVFHVLIGFRETIEKRNVDLESSNSDLANREETIATQNEELQAKTEELERQGEELRVTNEELESRERMLEQLLELSHSLTAELTRGALTARICDAVASLLNVPGSAAAILERQNGQLKVTACGGFTEGLHDEAIPMETSFAALVIDRGQTAYVEDLKLRPDLHIPRPKSGVAMRSILATPLRLHGKPVGTIEVYAPDPRNWSRKEIALLEALAAQASTSMENLKLFEEIEDQRRRLETIFRTLPIGVIISDAQYSDVRINAAGAAMLGEKVETNFARADAVGDRWWLEQNGRRLQLAEYPLVRALRSGLEVRGEQLEVVFDDGRRMAQLVSANPILDRAGLTQGAVSTFVDITALKELQRELEQRRRDAEEASIRKTRFLAAVSHDIRTPVNAINLLAELLDRTTSRPDLSGEVPEIARDLRSSAMSLVELVSDVLDVTRLDYGKVDLQETEFTLVDLLEEEGRRVRPLAQAKRLVLEVSPPVPAGLRLKTDRMKVGRVLANLLGNAIKFTDGGSVSLRASWLPDKEGLGELWLSVKDTGIGIAAEHLPQIFDEFFQIRNPARDRSKGTGLGLAICKRLVDAIGGKLAAQSTPGEGSTFTVKLPGSVVVGDGPMTAAPARRLRGAGEAGPLANLCVLVVEDHDPTRIATASILINEGARVFTAADVASALRLLDEQNSEDHVACDALLLDMMLPDGDGGDVLRYLKEHRPRGLRTILVLTGDVTPDRTAVIRDMGVDGLMHKPINPEALVSFLTERRGGGAEKKAD